MAFKPNHVRLVFLSALCAALLAAASCKSKEETAGGAGLPAKVVASNVTISGDLVARVPVNAFAVMRWEGGHPAYKKLMESPWGSTSEFSKLMEQSTPAAEKLQKVFTALGVDPAKPAVWHDVFADTVLFASPGPNPATPVVVGMIFKSAKPFSLKEKLPTLRTTLAADGATIEDAQLAPATGFIVKFKAEPADAAMDSVPGAGMMNAQSISGSLVIAATDDLSIIASDIEAAKQVFASAGNTQPTILASDTLSRALAGTPSSDSRFGTGLIDIQKFAAEVQKLATDPQAKQALEALPAFQAVGISLAMTDAPQTDVRLLFDPAKGGDSFVKQLSASESKAIVGGLPANPLLFLSVDGLTLKRLKDSALKDVPPEQQGALGQLALLDSVKRLAISIRVAEAGKTLIPLPDMLIAIESSSTQPTADALKMLIAGSLAQSGLAGGGSWASRTVSGATVQTLPAGFGFNVSVATTPNLVLVSTSDKMIDSMVNPKDPGAGAFAKSLSGSSSRVLSDASTIGNLYVNFREVGTLMETLGGTLRMFAPQDPTAAQMLTPEKIANIKKMGTMVAAIELGENVIGIQSFYQPVS